MNNGNITKKPLFVYLTSVGRLARGVKMNSELAQAKRKLFAIASQRQDFSVNDANAMIAESTYDGYQRLDEMDKWRVRENRNKLVGKIHNLGEVGAMELLAAIGDVLNEEEK